MPRLDHERQRELEPQRLEYAANQIKALGYDIAHQDEQKIKFLFKGETVIIFPYSGWHSGKSIKDGRGLAKLLKQIKK
jgi:hypothetical protein